MKSHHKLKARWSKREKDLLFSWPAGYQTQCDGGYLAMILREEIIKELDKRGYDITTLKFEISIKHGDARFTANTPLHALARAAT